MNNTDRWAARQARLGSAVLVAGIAVTALGVVLELGEQAYPFNVRLVTALGILLLGIAAAHLIRYASARRDPESARRMITEARDERNEYLRHRAASRAYPISAALSYAVLMYLSLYLNEMVPPLSDDLLWSVMMAVVVIPGLVYFGGLMLDSRRL